MEKTPSSGSEISTTVLTYASGTLKHHQKLRSDAPSQEVLSKCKGVIGAGQTRKKKASLGFKQAASGTAELCWEICSGGMTALPPLWTRTCVSVVRPSP